MSGESRGDGAERSRRVQRLKKIIVLLLLILIAIPIVCCVVLFSQMKRLNRRLEDMELQMTQLATVMLEHQEWLEEMNSGQGEALTGQSGADDIYREEVITAREPEQEEDALHRVYLTFDDGPSGYTDEILEILDRYDVKATFFVVGKEDEASRESLKRIAEEGHSVGLHSYSHKYSEVYWSLDDFAADVEALQEYVREVTGQESRIYRFPGGSSNTVSNIDMWDCVAYLQEQEIEFFDWNVSSGDGGSRLLSVEELVENVTEGITDRESSIILLHDAAEKTTTAEALPIIIEKILAMEDTVILPITEDTEPIHHLE